MNIQGLIERYEKFKASKKKMTSVDLILKDLRSLDEPEPLPFKLKDVVGRIRGFDPTTQARWLNDILKELGGDYGSMKYREGYEQGKLEGVWVGNQLKDADKIRQELNRPVIPQFVADWLEKCKNEEKSLLKSLLYTPAGVNSWVDNSENQETFARAYLDGYEIEKEKRYTVKLKGLEREKCYLNFNFGGVWLFYTNENFFGYRSHHTRKELEEAGFGGVFNSPLFEIEEVE
nr:MAG TPA: Protein of unknown function (DUF1642) [Caudoviricetes sp.]